MKFSIENHVFQKSKKNEKYVVFTELKEPKREVLDASIFFKICHVGKILIQNFTSCIFFNLESDALLN